MRLERLERVNLQYRRLVGVGSEVSVMGLWRFVWERKVVNKMRLMMEEIVRKSLGCQEAVFRSPLIGGVSGSWVFESDEGFRRDSSSWVSCVPERAS